MTFRELLYRPSNIIPLKPLIFLTSQKIIQPFYHAISDTRLPHISNLYELRNRKQFSKDIDFLCQNYTPVTIDRLNEIVRDKINLKKPVVHISFDDGLKEIFTEVAPILSQKGVPATVFLNTHFIDNKDLFYRFKISLIIEKVNEIKTIDKKIYQLTGTTKKDKNTLISKIRSLQITDNDVINKIAIVLNINFEEFLIKEQPYLTKYQISKLANDGFSFGSHSCNHPFFKDLSLEDQKNQIIESFNYLEKELAIKEKYFSFPFSDEGVTANIFEWLNEIDCKLSLGISGIKKEVFQHHLHRIPFDGVGRNADEIIKSEYLYFLVKAFFNKNKIIRKRA